MSIRLPDLPDGFTSEFLTELMHLCGALPHEGAVSSVAHEQLGDGTGMMAEITQLTLTYSGSPGAAPGSLIAKFASRNETNRGVANAFNLPERETRFASELARRTSIRTPKTYYSGTDEDRFLILMEDLTDYEVGDQAAGADLPRSELAVDELAKLHAPFWEKLDGLDWVPGVANSYHAEAMLGMSASGFDGVVEKFGDYLSERFISLRERYLAAVPSLQAQMNEPPVTLVHGDYRMANFLFATRPEHDQIVVLDWQGPLLARGMNDLALFLGQSTQTQVRRDHLQALVERYAAGLEQKGVPPLDRTALWHDFRVGVLYSWVYVFAVAGTLDVHNEAAYAWMARMVARQTAISEDLDVYELLP